MNSVEVYRTLREHLGAWFKAEGFARSTHTPLGWHRSSLLVWFQCNPTGWDKYGGSDVYVNFQTGASDRAWDGPVRRLQEFLTDEELELFRALQNRVVPKLKLPPREHVQALRAFFAKSRDAHMIVESYLSQFKPDETPYARHHDRALRYWDADDLAAWSAFLLPRLKRIVTEAAGTPP